MMKQQQGSGDSSWFLRVKDSSSLENIDWDPSIIAPKGREIVLNGSPQTFLKIPLASSLSAFRAMDYLILPPPETAPICFSKAVIGLASSCTRPNCEKLIGGSLA